MNNPRLPNHTAVERLICLKCEDGSLIISENGSLECLDCGHDYPRSPYGVYSFLSNNETRPNDSSQSNAHWDRHWNSLEDIDDAIISQEVAYIDAIELSAIPGKILIDAGCGPARNLEAYLKLKPKLIILCDLSNLATAAARWKKLSDKYPEADIIILQSDIYNLPIRYHQDNTYVSCGVLNILPDTEGAINHAQKISDNIFFLINSPENTFGKIYYALNPIRVFAQFLIRRTWLKSSLSKICSYLAFPFAWLIVRLKAREMTGFVERQSIEFLIFDWVFSSPYSKPRDIDYYMQIKPETFSCSITEKAISRIVHYSKK